MTTTFRKSAPATQISFEVAGLNWLRCAHGARVVPVLASGETWLEEPRLNEVQPSVRQARDFGSALAFTHAEGAGWFGQAPAGYTGAGTIGQAPLPLLTKGASSSSWGKFFAKYRIRPYLRPFTGAAAEVLEKFCASLELGTWDHAQPALVSTPAARTHGDLWGGNVMWTADGAVLIDPAASGGHAETDLANLALFGVPHRREIINGYQRVSPLASGWEFRLELHQMHLLVVHAYLFGGGYVHQSVEVAARYLRTGP